MRVRQTNVPRLIGAPLAAFALVAGLAGEAPAALTTERVASGLVQPLFATHVPGDSNRLFVVEQRGLILILDIESDPPVLLGGEFLDIQAEFIQYPDGKHLLGNTCRHAR